MSALVLEDREKTALFEILLAVHNDPALFFRAVLRQNLRRWQERVCNRIKGKLVAGETNIRALFRTCHGSGKTYLAAGLVLWWISRAPYSRALTLAQTWDGVENLIWPEVSALYKGSLLRDLQFGRCLTTKFDVGETWYAIGASSDRPERLEGHHSKTAAMRIVDEAKAVDVEVFEATEGMLDAPETFDLWISTPSISAGKFFERDTGPDTGVIREVVTIEDLIAEGVPGKVEWRAQRLVEWGEDSPEYQSRALARYIDNAEGALFPVSWIERAMAADDEIGGPVVAGMDVAGSIDGDANAVALCQGPDPRTERLRVLSVDSWHERDTMLSKGRALAIAKPHNALIAVDVVGLGKGVADALGQEKYPRSEYRSADRAKDPERFINRKAEDAWNLRERLEKGTIRLPNDQKLKAQARAMRYRITQVGKIQIIDPDDSPDLVDAMLIAVSNSGRSPLRNIPNVEGENSAGDWRRHGWS